MGDIYFRHDKIGQEEYKRYKEGYDQEFEKRYKELWWDSNDSKYADYPKEAIECHNNEVKRRLEEELWGSEI